MAQKYNLPDGYKGDTYEVVQFTLTIEGVALDLTGATINIEFREETKTGTVGKSISTASGITITDATGGVFVIDAFTMDLNANTYYYDIQITDALSIITTYIQGKLEVTQDVTT